MSIPSSVIDLSAHGPSLLRQLRGVLVVDVVESVRLMAVDEWGFVKRWRALVERFATDLLPRHQGRIVKSLGDGLLVVFADPDLMVPAALELIDLCSRLETDSPQEQRIELRLGAHIAEGLADDHDIYGAGVNLAARLTTLANPSEVVVSAELRDRLVDGLRVRVQDLGDCFLKHLARPVRAFRVASNEGLSPWPPQPGRLSLTLAVVPFSPRQHSADPAELGDALADAVNSALARVPGLQVVSRLSTAGLRQIEDSVAAGRDQLGAAYVVRGGFAVDGRSSLVHWEAVEARTGLVVGADRHRVDIEDLFLGVDAGVVELVAGVSRAVLNDVVNRVRGLPLPTLAGFTLFVGGVSLLHKLGSADFQRARHVLQHLREHYPRQAAPAAMLAKWHLLGTLQGWAADAEHEGRLAVQSARQALDLEPDHAMALAMSALSIVHFVGDLEQGRELGEQAIAVDPQEPQGWLTLAGIHSYQGRGDEAVACAQRCLALSPVDPCRFLFELLSGAGELARGAFGRAEALARSSLRLNRMHAATHRLLIIALMLDGKGARAREAAQGLLQVDPTFRVEHFARRYPGRHEAHAANYVQALIDAGLPP